MRIICCNLSLTVLILLFFGIKIGFAQSEVDMSDEMDPDSLMFYAPKEFHFVAKDGVAHSHSALYSAMPAASSAYDTELGGYRLYFYIRVSDKTHSCPDWAKLHVRYDGGDYFEFQSFDFDGVRDNFWSTFTTTLDIPIGKTINGFKFRGKRRWGAACRQGHDDTNEFTVNSTYVYPGKQINFPSDFKNATNAIGAYRSTIVATYYAHIIKLFRTDNISNENYLPETKKITYSVNKNFAGGKFYWKYRIGSTGSVKTFPGSSPGGSSLTFCGKDISADYLAAIKQGDNLTLWAVGYDGGFSSPTVTIDVPREAPRINSVKPVPPTCANEKTGSVRVDLSRRILNDEVLYVAIQEKDFKYYNTATLKSGSTFLEFKNLPAGEYEIVFLSGTDKNGKRPTYVGDPLYHKTTFILKDPPVLTMQGMETVATHCNGGKDGKMHFTAAGGTGSLYVLCNNKAVIANKGVLTEIAELSAGDYQVRLRDSKGCFLRDDKGNERVWNFTVGGPEYPVLLEQQSLSQPTGYGRSDGEIRVVASRGSGSGYMYSWEKEGSAIGGSSDVQGGLAAGSYRIWVKDGNYSRAIPQTEENTAGCRGYVDVVMGQPRLLTATVQLNKSISCNGYSDGELRVVTDGGTGGNEYQWQVEYGGGWVDKTDRSASLVVADGLKAGSYRVLVWDRNNNYAESAAFQLTEPAPYAVGFTLTQPLCQGGMDGKVEASVSGNNGGYSYKWQGLSANASSVWGGKGKYTLTVTDRQGCEVTREVFLDEPTALQASYSITRPSSDGSRDGSIYISAGGGTPGYRYEWTGGAVSNPLTGVRTDSTPYSVVVKDAHSCSVSLSARVVYPLEAVVRVKQEVSCYGGSDGLLEVFPTWGVSRHYRYQWYKIVGGSVTALSGSGKVSPPVGAGNYRVRVTDSENNSVTRDIVMNEPTALKASLYAVIPSAADASDGQIRVDVSGGTPGYTYAWNYRNSTANPLTGIPADSVPYRVTVRDKRGCVVSLSEQVLYPLGVRLRLHTPVSCKGKADGLLEALAEGGQSRHYRYEWYRSVGGRWNQLGGSGKVSPGLEKGLYQVKVRDTKGDVAMATLELQEPEKLTAGYELFSPTTPVAADGMIRIIPAGGTPGYTYEWEYNHATGNPLSGIPARNTPYGVTVKDAHLCEVKLQPVLLFPLQVKIGVSRPVSCHGMSDAALVATPAGGITEEYRYEWMKQIDGVWASFARGSENVSGVGPGKYRVVVQDVNDSTAMAELVLTEPEPLVASFDMVCPSSALASDGEILIHPSGGTPYADGTYRYEWEYGKATVNPLTGIAADSVPYHMVVKDSRMCEVKLSPRLIYPLGVTVRVKDSVSCYGRQDGALESVAEGGVSRLYRWQWYRRSAGGFKMIACRERIAGGLSAGEYRVKVWDSEDNEAESGVFVLGEPDTLTVSLAGGNPACKDGSDGWLEASVAGGTLPYEYHWQGNEAVRSARYEGLERGDYELVVADRRGCEALVRDTLTEPDSLLVRYEMRVPSEYGGADGMIRMFARGGTEPYVYLWDYDLSTSDCLTGIGASDVPYRVTVTDSHGCMAVDTPRMYNPLIVSIEVRDSVSCYGRQDGRLAAVFAGGAGGPYRFEWLTESADGWRLPESRDSLLPDAGEGVYRVRVRDVADSLGVSAAFVFLQPDSLQLHLSYKAPACYGERNGWVRTVVEGGVKPYRYVWAGREDAGYAMDWRNGLGDGVYDVVVTDSRGCEVEGQAVLEQPDSLTVSHEVVLPSVYGGDDGVIRLTAAGGTAPYRYVWDDPLVSVNPLTGLVARERCYRVMVTDGQGCRAVDSARMYEPVTVELEESGLIVCSGDEDAELTAHVKGGSGGPYRYEWYAVDGEWSGRIPGGDSILAGVTVGTYRLEAIDGEGHRGRSADHTVVSPDSLRLDFHVGHLLCKYDSDGWIEALPAGGEAPYRMEWAHGDTLARIGGLEEGFYEVRMTDKRGCFVTRRPQVNAPDELRHSMDYREPLAWQGEDGAVWVTAQGGTSPYRYFWKGFASETDTLRNVQAGSYEVTVKDANGCSRNGVIEVTQPPLLEAVVGPGGVISCHGNADGVLEASASGGVGTDYRFDWYRVNDGSLTYISSGDRCTGLVAGNYRVRVTDENGVKAWSADFGLGEPEVLKAVVSTDAVGCFGGDDGRAVAEVSGGTAPYRYLWTSGDRTQSVAGLTAGRYLVMVTDARQCRTEAVGEVGKPEELMVEHEVGGLVCKGDPGEIRLRVSGGTAPYRVNWEDGFIGMERDGLQSGDYAAVVTDDKGCRRRETFVLEEAEEVTVDLGEDLVLCLDQQKELKAVSLWEITEYRWLRDGVKLGSSEVLNVNAGGLYRLEVVTREGCRGSGEVKVSENHTEISCNFAMASEVEEGKRLKIVNTCLPMPEYCEWIVPESGAVMVADEQEDLLELVIEQTGVYTVGLRSVTGGCEAYLYKEVTVVEEGTGGPATRSSERVISDIQVWPNPNDGHFRVRIGLERKADGLLRLYATTGALVREMKCEGSDVYEFTLNESLPVGIYILHVVFGTEREAVKVAVE